ncbi:hypothetical protein A2V61_00265 [Candidatus Woesebacteria bacterium RBG_19FT_COMBO_47_8]|nr:MAG: hypothetical protein A2V61_00265 [Candidatus Woesebacteria bacterium RBG_19FT_COMBO_47_8]
MNLGLPELGVLGVLILLLFGGTKITLGSKKKKEETLAAKPEIDPKANFQNLNTTYPESPKKDSPKA